MATLVHAPATHDPVRPWSPLRIGVVWALATSGGALAGAGLALVLDRWLFSGIAQGDLIGGFISLLFLVLVGGSLMLIVPVVAQALVLARLCGPAGWTGGDTLAWVFATIGAGLVNLVLYGVAFMAMVQRMLVSTREPSSEGLSGNAQLLLSGAAILVFGACVGGAQELVLRRYVPRVGLWVAANAAGLLVGVIAASGISTLVNYLVPPEALQIDSFSQGLFAGGVGLLVLGAVTGAALAVLLGPLARQADSHS